MINRQRIYMTFDRAWNLLIIKKKSTKSFIYWFMYFLWAGLYWNSTVSQTFASNVRVEPVHMQPQNFPKLEKASM